jgi:hypothetical protein
LPKSMKRDGRESTKEVLIDNDEQHRKQVLLDFSFNILPKFMKWDGSESTKEVLTREKQQVFDVSLFNLLRGLELSTGKDKRVIV